MFILKYHVTDVKLSILCLKRAGKKTTSKSDAKCVIIVLCQVGKNLRWDQGLLSLQLTQWSDAYFTGSKHVSSFVTSKFHIENNTQLA